MNKKLPGVYANKISNNATHNISVAYSSHKEIKEDRSASIENTTKIFPQNVNQKINSIFSSTKYVYKADVNITLKDQVIKRRIVGRNGVHLITIDNELIPIGDILDIEFSN